MKNIILYLITSFIAIWFASQVLYPASQTLTHGFGAYYSAARLLQTGQFSAQVYDPAYFRPIVRADSHQQADDIYNANPPTASLMLWPLSFLSIERARLIWTLTNAALLFGGLALLTLTFAPQPNLPTFAWLASLGMLFQPALENIKLGQAYLLIFALLSIAVAAWSKLDKLAPFADPLSGAALALALVLKTAGWALLPIMAWQRHWRSLTWTVGVAGAILLFTLPLFPPSLWQTYGQLLRHTSNSSTMCAAAYQTTRSLLCHLFVFDPPWSQSPFLNLPWLATLLFVGLALITLAINFELSRHHQSLALMASVTWGVIFAPLGEQYHHTVILIPLSWLVAHRLVLSWVSRISLLAAICLYLLPLPLNQSDWPLLAYPRVYGAALVLFTLYGQLTESRALDLAIQREQSV